MSSRGIFLAFLAAGVFWVAAFVLLGWLGIVVMALLGIVGEVILFATARAHHAHDARRAEERMADWRKDRAA